MRKILTLLTAAMLVIVLAGCGGQIASSMEADSSGAESTSATGSTTANGSDSQSGSTTETSGGVSVAGPIYATYDDEDEDETWDVSDASVITLKGGSIGLDGPGATVDGNNVMITSSGTYVITGTLEDGQVIVDSQDDSTVKLVLNGASIACSTSAPIYIKSTDKVVITLEDGTENLVTDGDSYVFDDVETQEPNAAIFSKADLSINGGGSLTVTANYNNGIVSKDDLKITGGNINVTAINDGLKGRDCIGIKAGTVTVNAGGDGLQSNNDVDAERGYISISGGILDIMAGTDGIQAETSLAISDGKLTILTGGGSENSSQAVGQPGNTWGDWGQSQPVAPDDSSSSTADSVSAKALKANGGVYVEGGTFSIDSSDDSVHSNNVVIINSGSLSIASGDDGIHADATLEIDGGDINITKCYEGMESALVTINNGNIHVAATDDAINVAGGADGSSVNGRMGQDAFAANENNWLYINGGYIAIDALGDGVDCNGRIVMTDGTLLVNGPTNDANGAIDYLGEFTVSGGCVVAAGSSGMAEAPSESSTLRSIMVNLDTTQEAGTLVCVQDKDGEELLTFAPTKQYQSLVFCSPALEEGATYTVYLGGSSTGSVTDSLYSGGTYAAGTEYVSLTISGIVTISGSTGGMKGGGNQNGGMPDGSMGTKPRRVPGSVPQRDTQESTTTSS